MKYILRMTRTMKRSTTFSLCLHEVSRLSAGWRRHIETSFWLMPPTLPLPGEIFATPLVCVERIITIAWLLQVALHWRPQRHSACISRNEDSIPRGRTVNRVTTSQATPKGGTVNCQEI